MYRILQMEGKEKTHGWRDGTEEDGVAVRDTRDGFGTGECERFRGNRDEIVGTAPPPQQSQRELKLHIQEELGSEQQGV